MSIENDDKKKALRKRGCLNPRPEDVRHPLFDSGKSFFDPLDLMQVKYEMLRQVRIEGNSVSQAAADFGFSRPSFYEARSHFEKEGLSGLVPKKRGPKAGHKITAEIIRMLEQAIAENPDSNSRNLADLVQERFGLEVHPRSIERALAHRKKNSG